MAAGLPQAGERVLDVGSGCGDSTMDLAHKVAPAGTVVGIDVSAMMLARARERAAGTDLNVSFIDDDAQTHVFDRGSFNLLFSRFGTMFFAAPQAAFVNLRRALGAGGRIAFVCWRAREENPWMTIPVQAAARYLPRPQPSPPRAPGPFAFAERDYVLEILHAAGFRDIEIEAHDEHLRLGDDLESAVEHSVRIGPDGTARRRCRGRCTSPRACRFAGRPDTLSRRCGCLRSIGMLDRNRVRWMILHSDWPG